MSGWRPGAFRTEVERRKMAVLNSEQHSFDLAETRTAEPLRFRFGTRFPAGVLRLDDRKGRR